MAGGWRGGKIGWDDFLVMGKVMVVLIEMAT
jgi:hypothetical protein